MEIVIAVVIGIVVGSILTVLVMGSLSSGNLRIDQSIPEEDPYLFLELTKSVSTILHKKFVILKVRAEDFIPHK